MYNQVFNHEYFLEALSGRFRPPSDPAQQEHTLGRLILGTVEKGVPEFGAAGKSRYTYTPSWAPVEAQVNLLHDRISRLTLGSSVGSLIFVNNFVHNHTNELIIMDYSVDSLLPEQRLTLGYEFGYDDQQQVVTDTAQRYFDKVSYKQVKFY